jgi:hypothetical protein
MIQRLVLALAILAVSVVPAQARDHSFRGGHGRFEHFDHFHHRFGGPRVFIGPRLFIGPDPFWYPYPYPYYAAPPVVVEPEPQVYVEPPPVPPAQSYWYYCEAPKGYYPYVAQCPGGWIQVVPRTDAPAQ